MVCTMSNIDPDLMPAKIRERFGPVNRAIDHSVLTDIDDDDCAVVRVRGQADLVWSTDFINASPIGLEMGVSTYRDLGWLAVAVNVADVLASGAVPMGLLLALTLPRDISVLDFDDLLDGVAEACEEFAVPLAGGDTKLGPSRAIAASCIGRVPEGRQPFLRRNAKPGEALWLAGAPGECAAALLLAGDRPSPAQLELVGDAIRRPVLPYEPVLQAIDAGSASAGTDISDGLAADLHAIARASAVQVVVDAAAVTAGPLLGEAVKGGLGTRFGIQCATGGDLAMVFTAPSSASSSFRRSGMTKIGEIRAGSGVLAQVDGTTRAVEFEGHRDSRGLSFLEEVRLLAGRLA